MPQGVVKQHGAVAARNMTAKYFPPSFVGRTVFRRLSAGKNRGYCERERYVYHANFEMKTTDM